jgi:hypothetical protein
MDTMNDSANNKTVFPKPVLITPALIFVAFLSACSGKSSTVISKTPETPATAMSPTVTVAAPPILQESAPQGAEQEFSTDFTISSISFDEILSGGPPKDGIPALNNPQFLEVENVGDWIGDLEPVIVFENQGDVRIYPLQILIWHEIVNDVVGDMPVTITFCPLCNTAIAFDATFNGMVLDFGTTGRLRYSNLVMYDRQTETWWQQATGFAIVGELTGSQLTFLPTSIISWGQARQNYPDAKVLSRETGYNRNYGRNPYTGYDNVNSSPFLYDGPPTPGELPAMARITTVDINNDAVAYPNDALQSLRVINDTVGGKDIVVFWEEGLASALDSSEIASGEDVGATGVFERTLAGQTLTFVLNGETIIDEQTGSVWNIFGQAISGDLSSQSLTTVVKIDHFWFSWAAFRPDTRIYQP